MKIIFDHTNGEFNKNGNSLLEVFAIKEGESDEYMFNNGWLPFQDRWYQTRSSRLKLSPVSKRRKKELSKINISHINNIFDIADKAIIYEKFDYNYLKDYLKLNYFKFFFDDCFCGVVNLINDIPYYTFMLWDESNKDHSYGTLSFYYLIDKFYNEGHKYLYTSEYYPLFSYKENLQGFEWWNGEQWVCKD